MANPRVFISFDHDNNENHKMLFAGQARNSKTPFSIEDWSAKSAMPQSQWEQIVRDKINRCNILLVLVGNRMSTALGVVKEIAMARAQNVPVFGVYIDGAGVASVLPYGLPRNRTIRWEWDAVADAIDQLMREGKNQ